jgi:hypothetical protein
MSIKDRIEKINQDIEMVKSDYLKFIHDESIPLSERWETFLLAPSAMKETSVYTPSFISLPEDFIMYEGPYHMDKGETTTTKRMIENIEEKIQEVKDEDSFYEEHVIEAIKKVDIIALKEEILAMNLDSFCYDW